MWNTLPREEVLKVGINTHFREFTINLVQKKAILYHILCMHYKMNFLYSHVAGNRYFKAQQLIWIYIHVLCCEKAKASAGRYQNLLNSIYCLRLIHDMNKYCLYTNCVIFSVHHVTCRISHVNTS